MEKPNLKQQLESTMRILTGIDPNFMGEQRVVFHWNKGKIAAIKCDSTQTCDLERIK